MLRKTRALMLSVSLLGAGFAAFADSDQPWKIAFTKLNGAWMPVVQVDEEEFNGFIACYSHDAEMPSYSVGNDIYVKGFIAMRGQHIGRIFHPEGYLNVDISPAYTTSSTTCQNHIPSCRNEGTECWAGGDTGGYFSHLLRAMHQ